MNRILPTVALTLVLLLALQTYGSAKTHHISVTCQAAEVENAACMSLGPLGTLNRSSIRFWITKFIDHGINLPKTIQNTVQKWIHKRSY